MSFQPSETVFDFYAAICALNGESLDGWFGLGHFDPREWRAMSDAEREAKKAATRPEFEQHWRVEKDELINDGFGPYATTEEEFDDIELLLEYKTVALADSGIYLRGNPQVQIWDYTEAGGKWELGADKGSGGLWNNSPGAPGKDPLVFADKPFGKWNRMRTYSNPRPHDCLFERSRRGRSRRHGKLLGPNPAPLTGVIQPQTHAAKFAGATFSSARSRPPKPKRS